MEVDEDNAYTSDDRHNAEDDTATMVEDIAMAFDDVTEEGSL